MLPFDFFTKYIMIILLNQTAKMCKKYTGKTKALK